MRYFGRISGPAAARGRSAHVAIAHLKSGGRTLAVLGLFAGLTVVHTWPLAEFPSTRLMPGPDVKAGMWALVELTRQLTHDPAHLLDGNIFYPFPDTLAVIDHQLGNAVLAVPLVVSGAAGVQVYNVVLLTTFFLSGVFTYLLVRKITGSVAAGLVSGCAFAFSGFRASHLPHSHLLATQWLPLALLALHGYLARPTWRRWATLAFGALLVALSSWHIAILGGAALVMVALWTMAGDRKGVRRRALGLALVGVLCAAAVLPLAGVYTRVAARWPPQTGQGRETMGTLIEHSANVAGLVALPAASRAPYASILSYFQQSQPGIFPGLVTIALALPALAMLRKVRSRSPTRTARFLNGWLWTAAALVAMITVAAAFGERSEAVVALLRPLSPFVLFGLGLAVTGLVIARRAGERDRTAALVSTYAAVAVGGALLALGPRVLVGSVDVGSGLWRLDLLPVRLIMRAPARLSLLLTLGTCVLAGIGVSQLSKRLSSKKQHALTVVILLALNLDLAFALPSLAKVPPPGAVDRWLAQSPDEGAVIEYPLVGNHWSVHASQQYGRRIVNGRGYLWPPPLNQLEAAPDLSPQQLTLLWEHFHPRFVVVRGGLYTPSERARVLGSIKEQPDALRLRAQAGQDHVYELIDRGRGAALYRLWPVEELRDKRNMDVTCVVTPGRGDTEAELVVSLNGHILLEVRGAEAETPSSRSVSFGAEHLVRGINTFEIRAGYRFTRTADRNPIGTTGVELAADVAILSDRDRSSVEVNGRRLSVDKGYFLAVLDPGTGAVTTTGAFNSSWYERESDDLVAFVRNVPAGSPVLVATEFDASRRLTARAVDALRELGLQTDLRQRLNVAHAAVGVKGAPPGSALESTGPRSATVTLGQMDQRVVQMASLQLR